MEQEITLEQAIATAKRQWRPSKWSSTLPHCFWSNGMLIAVFTDPKLFPSKFSKLERDALIKASFRDGTYHHIVVVAVNQDESGCPVVTKFKNLKDYNYWCKNRGL